MNNLTVKNPPDIKWIEGISRMLDSRFRFPGTNFRFGLDPILGLIPVVGDVSTFFVSALLILHASTHGASSKVMTKMWINVLIDLGVGAIPILGSLFDFVFKANDKNLKLLKEHYQTGKHSGSGKGIVLFIVILVLIVLGLIMYGIIKLFAFLIDYLF